MLAGCPAAVLVTQHSPVTPSIHFCHPKHSKKGGLALEHDFQPPTNAVTEPTMTLSGHAAFQAIQSMFVGTRRLQRRTDWPNINCEEICVDCYVTFSHLHSSYCAICRRGASSTFASRLPSPIEARRVAAQPQSRLALGIRDTRGHRVLGAAGLQWGMGRWRWHGDPPGYGIFGRRVAPSPTSQTGNVRRHLLSKLWTVTLSILIRVRTQGVYLSPDNLHNEKRLHSAHHS